MPGKMLPPSRSRAIRFSRNSSFTRRVFKRDSEKALRRSSPSVCGIFIADALPTELVKNDLLPEYTPLDAGHFAPKAPSFSFRRISQIIPRRLALQETRLVDTAPLRTIQLVHARNCQQGR